jgi:hypothetical protein
LLLTSFLNSISPEGVVTRKLSSFLRNINSCGSISFRSPRILL